jgi:DNA-binding NtrC family response regulator
MPDTPSPFSKFGSRQRAPAVEGKKKPSVLVVDDDEGMRDMLQFALSREGFEVTTADSGRAAVAHVQRCRFDVAVTDLTMPGMDGIATLAALKDIDPNLEVIVATGYGGVDVAMSAMRGGAFDYISKPFDLQELHQMLNRALAHGGSRSELRGVAARMALLAAGLGRGSSPPPTGETPVPPKPGGRPPRGDRGP